MEFRYLYKSLSVRVKNKQRDLRKRYGVEAVPVFEKDSKWRLYDLDLEDLKDTGQKLFTMYYGTEGFSRVVEWRHPNYHELLAANLADQQ